MFQPLIQVPGNTIYELIAKFYPELKFWGSIGGVFWLLFKGVQWLKTIKTNDLEHIHQGIEQMGTDLKAQTIMLVETQKENSTAIIGELKELRADMRSLTGTIINIKP